MAKEGFAILTALLASSIILLVGWKLTNNTSLCGLSIITIAFALFSIYFFRDPQREIVKEDNEIVSPGDGKIVEICKVEEDEYLHSKAVKVAIFLSIFDVHISRVPMQGQVEFMRYHRGKFLPAYSRRSGSLNEQTVIGVKTRHGKILFKQIAGTIARRIVCNLREGYFVEKGEKFGIIKFGSRMEIYLPKWAKVTVKLGDKVKAGVTMIGRVDEQ